MNSIVVFCGSSHGYSDLYRTQAFLLGKILAHRGIRIIYGGARVGLMGAVADGAIQEGGEVTGVLPRFLQTKEIAHTGLTDLVLTDTMHERKTKMHELSDAIIALPGGYGTLEELFEMLTWAQLGLHHKPIGLLNINGYYTCLQQMATTMMQEGFLRPEHYAMLIFSDDIEDLLAQMDEYVPLPLRQWIKQEGQT